MANYGSIGRTFEGTVRFQLANWSGIPVRPLCNTIALINSNPHRQFAVVGFNNHPMSLNNIDNSGTRYTITEVVTRLNNTTAAPIIVLDRQTKEVVVVTASGEDGVVTITGLNPERLYTLIALDPFNAYNASVLDLKRPK